MKKTMLLWPLLLLSAIGCTENNSENDPVVDPNLNPPLTFAVISDVHIGNNVAEGPMVKVPQALRNITSYGELDAMVIVGDLTDHGEVAEYEQFVETFTDSTHFTNPYACPIITNFTHPLGKVGSYSHINYYNNSTSKAGEGG